MSQWFEKILEDVDKLDVFNEETQKSERGRGKVSKSSRVPITADIHVTSTVNEVSSSSGPVDEVVHHVDVEQPLGTDYGGVDSAASADELTAENLAVAVPSTPSATMSTTNADGTERNFGQYRTNDHSTVKDLELNENSAQERDDSDHLRALNSHTSSIFRDFMVSSGTLISSSFPEFGENEAKAERVAGSAGGGSLVQSLYQTAHAAAAIGVFEDEEDIEDFEYNDPILKKIQANKERMLSGQQLNYALSQVGDTLKQSDRPGSPQKLNYSLYNNSKVLTDVDSNSGYSTGSNSNSNNDGSRSFSLGRGTIFNGYHMFHSEALPVGTASGLGLGERYHQNNLLLLTCCVLYGVITLIVDKCAGRSVNMSKTYISTLIAETKDLVRNQWMEQSAWERWFNDLDAIAVVEYVTSPYGFGVLTFLLLYYMYFKFGRYSTDVIDV